MPDTITDFTAQFAPVPMSPLRIVDQIIDAFQPERMSVTFDRQMVVETLKPVIGHFTVSDAVLLINGLKSAARWQICSGEGKHAHILGLVASQLHDFICSGQPAGPACAAGRAAYCLDTTRNDYWTAEDRRVVAIMLAKDIDDLRWGSDYYWCGSLFGGGNIDPDEANEPEDWWDWRERMLKMHRGSMGASDA